ncbi:hypothetical protein ACJZ2D_015534 [Fusarium nematophilum]
MAGSQTTAPSGLRPAKRYIVTHDPTTGKSIYVADAPGHVYHRFPGFAHVARSYATSSLPAQLGDEEDIRSFTSTNAITSYTRARDFRMPAPNGEEVTGRTAGVNVNILDLIPGAVGHWHRTLSFDISICVIGEADHELDGGEKVRLLAGDHIIQRSTMHRWSNPSKDHPARVIATVLPCEPFMVVGQTVQESHLPFGQELPGRS